MIKIFDVYKKISKNEKRILFMTALILGAAFVDRVVLLPLTTNLSALSSNIKEQESSIKKSMNMLLHKETIIEESRDYAQYSIEAKNSEEEMVGLLRVVESVAEKSGVSLIYVKPGTIKEEKGTKTFYANLECEAPMEQVATFFHEIESSNNLLKIEKFQITPKSKDSSIARCSVSVYKTVLAK